MSWPRPPRRDRRRDPGPPSRSPRRPAPARLPSGLAVLLCAYAALGAAYAWRIPILEGADENGHASYVDFVTAHHAVPPIGTVWEAVQPPLYYGVAAGVVALAGAPRLMPPALRLNPGFRFDAVTSADAYDPHSYTPAEAVPARRLRLLSTLFGALTLGLIYAAAVAASGRRSLALAATALPALTPQFVHHHAVITNDALATTWCALLTWQIVRRTASATPAPAPDRRPPGAVVSAAAMGVVAGLGMWTKYTMAPVAAAAGVVLLLGRADGTAGPRRRLRRAAAFTIAALVVCGPLLAWNTLRYGDPLAHAAMRRAHAALAVDRSALALTVDPSFLFAVFKSYWGMLGSLTVPLHVDAYAAFGLVSALGIAGLPLAIRRRVVHPACAAALVAIAALTWLAFLAHNTRFNAPQGRLLFPALPAISILLAAGWSALVDAAAAAAGRRAPAAAAALAHRRLGPAGAALAHAAAAGLLIAGLLAVNAQTLVGPVQHAFHDAPDARDRLARAERTRLPAGARADAAPRAALTAVAAAVIATGVDRPAHATGASDGDVAVAARTVRAAARPAPPASPPVVDGQRAMRAPMALASKGDGAPPAAAAGSAGAAAAAGNARRRPTGPRRKPTPPSGVGPDDGRAPFDGVGRRIDPNTVGPAPQATAAPALGGGAPEGGPVAPAATAAVIALAPPPGPAPAPLEP